jgi:hypothetical protein
MRARHIQMPQLKGVVGEGRHRFGVAVQLLDAHKRCHGRLLARHKAKQRAHAAANAS